MVNCCKGKDYFDAIEKIVRQGYFADENSTEKQNGMDFLWYLWCGENSPIFCKDAMKTFERYYINDRRNLEKEHKIHFIHSAKMKMFVKKYLGDFWN